MLVLGFLQAFKMPCGRSAVCPPTVLHTPSAANDQPPLDLLADDMWDLGVILVRLLQRVHMFGDMLVLRSRFGGRS